MFLVCAVLEAGVLSGVPMRPDEIRELMQQMNRPKLAHVLPAEEEGGDDGPRDVRHSAANSAIAAKGADR